MGTELLESAGNKGYKGKKEKDKEQVQKTTFVEIFLANRVIPGAGGNW